MKLIKLTAIAAALVLAACADKPVTTAADTEMAAAPAAAAVVDSKAADAQKQTGFESRIADVLAMAHRSEANRARDKYRHPAETLSFFGLTETQTVVEISPGGGWYTEILAPLLNERGTYLAALNDPEKASNERAKAYYAKQNAEFEAKFKANPELYGKAAMVLIDAKAPNFGAAGSADLVLTFRNVHNWMGQGAEKNMFKGFFDVLKAGGKLGVTEHRAALGTDPKASAESGYLSEEVVIQLALDAGFVLEAKSEINANPLDTKDYKGGVWTLPPTLGEGEVDKAKYLAIGESDRMTLLFKKP
jgi:predicted methyltransferase